MRIFFKVSIPPISSIANPKLKMKIKKQKIIFFSLIVNVLIISGLELGAGYWLQNKTIYSIPGLMKNPTKGEACYALITLLDFIFPQAFRVSTMIFDWSTMALKS